MIKKPIIGIVGRSDMATEEYSVICCYESVRRSIIKKGGIPILILPNQDIEYEKTHSNDIETLNYQQKEDLKKIIDICDGILIPGTYRLYEYDKFIYEYSLDKDIPVLAICGGMQLMGLVDNNEGKSSEILIKIDTLINHFKRGKEYVHKVNIDNNFVFYKILQKDVINVNSRHNYHITKANKLNISAISEDGIIEALEHPNKRFVLGVEWHPESMLDYDESANKIYEYFINECSLTKH